MTDQKDAKPQSTGEDANGTPRKQRLVRETLVARGIEFDEHVYQPNDQNKDDMPKSFRSARARLLVFRSMLHSGLDEALAKDRESFEALRRKPLKDTNEEEEEPTDRTLEPSHADGNAEAPHTDKEWKGYTLKPPNEAYWESKRYVTPEEHREYQDRVTRIFHRYAKAADDARSLDGVNEAEWRKLLESHVFSEMPAKDIFMTDPYYPLLQLASHSDVVWTEEINQSSSDEKLPRLSSPKPDITFGYPVFGIKDKLPTDHPYEPLAQTFSYNFLKKIRAAKLDGIKSTVIARLHNPEVPIGQLKFWDRICFPWAVVEFKHAHQAEAPVEFCYCQAANASAAAYELYRALFAEAGENDIPPVVVFTCIGPDIRVWLTYHISSGDTTITKMTCIFVTSFESAWGALATRQIFDQTKKWVMEDVKKRLSRCLEKIGGDSNKSPSDEEKGPIHDPKDGEAHSNVCSTGENDPSKAEKQRSENVEHHSQNITSRLNPLSSDWDANHPGKSDGCTPAIDSQCLDELKRDGSRQEYAAPNRHNDRGRAPKRDSSKHKVSRNANTDLASRNLDSLPQNASKSHSSNLKPPISVAFKTAHSDTEIETAKLTARGRRYQEWERKKALQSQPAHSHTSSDDVSSDVENQSRGHARGDQPTMNDANSSPALTEVPVSTDKSFEQDVAPKDSSEDSMERMSNDDDPRILSKSKLKVDVSSANEINSTPPIAKVGFSSREDGFHRRGPSAAPASLIPKSTSKNPDRSKFVSTPMKKSAPAELGSRERNASVNGTPESRTSGEPSSHSGSPRYTDLVGPSKVPANGSSTPTASGRHRKKPDQLRRINTSSRYSGPILTKVLAYGQAPSNAALSAGHLGTGVHSAGPQSPGGQNEQTLPGSWPLSPDKLSKHPSDKQEDTIPSRKIPLPSGKDDPFTNNAGCSEAANHATSSISPEMSMASRHTSLNQNRTVRNTGSSSPEIQLGYYDPEKHNMQSTLDSNRASTKALPTSEEMIGGNSSCEKTTRSWSAKNVPDQDAEMLHSPNGRHDHQRSRSKRSSIPKLIRTTSDPLQPVHSTIDEQILPSVPRKSLPHILNSDLTNPPGRQQQSPSLNLPPSPPPT